MLPISWIMRKTCAEWISINTSKQIEHRNHLNRMFLYPSDLSQLDGLGLCDKSKRILPISSESIVGSACNGTDSIHVGIPPLKLMEFNKKLNVCLS